MNIEPLYDRVVVCPCESEKTSEGGIVLPDTANKERPMEGEIVAVGAGKLLDNGDVRPLTVKKGQKIIYGKYAGTEVKNQGKEYVILREDDIMGVVVG